MLAVVRPALSSASKRLQRWAVLTPLFFLPAERKIHLERWIRGREQAQKLRHADVTVVSFGKSGRTWLRVMLSRAFQVKHGLSDRLLIGFDNFHLRNRAIPRIFFTHDNYLKDYTGHQDTKEDYASTKVILLVRHPADVAVSQFHQWQFRMRPHKKTINDYPEHGRKVPIFDFVAHHEAGLAKVVDFMNGWARALPLLPDVLLVRYEDMKAAPGRELARMLDFMGTPGTADEIEEAVRFSSFENMRKLEERRAFWFSGGRMVAKDRKNPNSFKTRRGKVGGWRDYFSAEEAATIESMIRERLDPVFAYDDTRKAETSVAAGT
jgi:hypothetical protein